MMRDDEDEVEDAEERRARWGDEPALVQGVRDAEGVRDLSLDFSGREYSLGLIRELDAERRRRRDERPGQRHLDLLARVVDRWGGVDLRPMSLPQRARFLGERPLTDIIAAVVHYRVRELGPRYSIRWSCPSCRREAVMGFDLDEVRIEGDPGLPPAWVRLTRPVRRATGPDVVELLCDAPRWSALRRVAPGGGAAELAARATESAVTAVRLADGTEGPPLAAGEWDRIHGRDLAALSIEVDRRGSVDIGHVASCPSCAAEARISAETDVDFFFGSRSLQPEPTPSGSPSGSP